MGRIIYGRETLMNFILLLGVLGSVHLPLQNFPLAHPAITWEVPGNLPSYPFQSLPMEMDPIAPEFYDLVMVDNPRVSQNITLLTGRQKDWFYKSLERSFPYQDYIFEALEEAQVPREIFYLALVESGFSSGATSRVGAGGMWQFMPATAKWVGMSMNQWVDERRDFMKATEQAIKTLQYNHKVLGDWYLAMAAYNAGLGRISNIIKRSGIKDYWALLDKGLLPAETAMYVPRIMAASQLAHKSGRLGIPMSWESPLAWDTLALTKSVDLKILAELSGVPFADLKNLNSELKYTITPDLPGGYKLKVPVAALEPLRAALANPNLTLMRYHIYKIRSGDTLSELSQHYGVNTEMIQKYNPGLRPQFLRLGQEVLIPALKDVAAYPGKKPQGPLPPVSKDQVVVQQGDTLWSLSRKYGTTVEVLARLNGIGDGRSLSLGQRLKLPVLGGGL